MGFGIRSFRQGTIVVWVGLEAHKVVIYQRLPSHSPHDCQESPTAQRLTLTNHSQIWGPVTECDGAPHVSGW
jgi:hypothetical protein